MAELKRIVAYLDRELDLNRFDDSSLNGLQVEGSGPVNKIAAAVDAGISVIDEAIDNKVDLLLVHHGIFWGKPFAIRGSKKELLKKLLDANLSLYAAHLPLDAHKKYGNNFSLARLLKLESLEETTLYRGSLIGCQGINKKKKKLNDLVKILEKLPGAKETNFHVFNFGPKVPQKVSIISGSGVDELLNFEENDFDTLVTGEAKQFAYHFAKENKLNLICAGHYATETIGVRNIVEATAKKFKLKHIFIDQPTGI